MLLSDKNTTILLNYQILYVKRSYKCIYTKRSLTYVSDLLLSYCSSVDYSAAAVSAATVSAATVSTATVSTVS